MKSKRGFRRSGRGRGTQRGAREKGQVSPKRGDTSIREGKRQMDRRGQKMMEGATEMVRTRQKT